MEETSSEILELRFAARRRWRLEDERKAAVADLRARVLDAHDAGVPVALIAREADLSRQAVYEMLGVRRLSPRRQSRTLHE